jgi:hypothetical protein
LTASVGQQQSGATADPQVLRAKSITAHSHPVPISSAADLRRPSSGSVISSSDADASSVSRLPLSGVDSHVPHLICKWKPQSICPLASGCVIGWSGVCWRWPLVGEFDGKGQFSAFRRLSNWPVPHLRGISQPSPHTSNHEPQTSKVQLDSPR